MNNNCSLSVILPAFNEGSNIAVVIENIHGFLSVCNFFKEYEIIVVNDGSTDNTSEVLKEINKKFTRLKIITHTKNLGYGKALLTGVEASKYTLLLFMDADGQFNIRELERAVCYLKEFDIIMGYRINRADSFYRTVLAVGYRWLVFLFFGLKFTDVNCGFKLFKKSVFDGKSRSIAGVFYTEVLLKARRRGFKMKEIPVSHFPRLRGRQTGGAPEVIFDAIMDLLRLKYALFTDKIKKS